jgi:hypothetical protein
MDSNHQYLSRGQRRVIANSTLGGSEPPLALEQRPRAEILAVEVEKIEQEEDRRGGRDGIRWAWIMVNEVTPPAGRHSSPSGQVPRSS